MRILAKFIAPFARRLFPDVPRDNPALSAIIMNLAANILGLGNAATPFGLKAMEHLQEINPDKEAASPAMITFLALNTSCITIVPTLVISLRVQAGSVNPTEIIGATILSTAIGTVCALIFNGFFRRRYFRK
jgi:spore maturation protein A